MALKRFLKRLQPFLGMEKPKKQSFLGLVIDGDKGEKAYQVHLFETPKGELVYQISSKINAEGKIDAKIRGFTGPAFIVNVQKPTTKQEFDQGIKELITAFQNKGLTHRLIDLSNCQTIAEQLALLQKMEPQFKINICER